MKISISNNEIKRIKSLSQKKFRDEYGLFVVEGEKLVEEAVKSGFGVEAVYRRDDIGEDTMSRISQLNSPSPVLAVVRKPAEDGPGGIPDKGLYLGLDSVRDPGNLGTLIRIIFRVGLHYCDLARTAEGFLSHGGKVYGTFLDGKNIYCRDLAAGEDSPVLVIMGNESEGISAGVAAKVSDRLYIPPYPPDGTGSESLNVAVAAAVTVAEFRRRINVQSGMATGH